MATQDDVRRLALALDGAVESTREFAFRADGRLFVWAWLERVDPKKRKQPNPDVVVVRVASELDKQALIDLDPGPFFTEPHYDGYAMVLIRLPTVDEPMLSKLIVDSWRLATAKKKRG